MSEYELSWLIGCSIARVEHEETGRWLFTFSSGGIIAAHCPWRLLHEGMIAVSSDDHGQRFGLPATIDAAAAIFEMVTSRAITAVRIANGTADLALDFGSAHELQIIPISSGFEAWETVSPSGFLLIAQSQGQLSGFKP